MPTPSDDWNSLLDQIKEVHECKTEVKLSNLIGISQSMLGHVRSGRRELSLNDRLKVLHLLNQQMNLDSLLICISDRERETFLALQQQQRSKLPL